MDFREQRGRAIAEAGRVTKSKSGSWLVPSQSGSGKYTVRLDEDRHHCTCPDFELRESKCKHIYAVEYTIKSEQNVDGTTTVTETLTVQKKTTYKQVWACYNKAQSVEKDRLQVLLFDLCQGLAEPEHKGRGRKPHSIRDTVFAMVFKVYGTLSSRRTSSDLREAHQRGYLSKPIPGLKVPQFFENPDLFDVLRGLVHQSSLPLRVVERDFAVDSSGFGSSRYERWTDEKYGKPRKKATWIKTHIACGVKTNVVTAVRILDRDTNDCPQLSPLMKETNRGGFTVNEVSADKAYGSYENFENIEGMDGEPFIAFKLGVTGARGGAMERAYHYFSFRREEFLQHYHKRSNVESVFSAVKRKFGDSVRSKTDDAMKNEVLCKLIAHNLCCLIQEQHELGIESVFWGDAISPTIKPERSIQSPA